MLGAGRAFSIRIGGRPRGHRLMGFALFGVSLLIAGGLLDPEPRLVWNVSRSAPRGLYWVSQAARPGIGDFAAARLSSEFEELAARRHYLPAGVPLIKRVAAVQGDEVCATDDRISLFGTRLATRMESDPAGRPMPWWSGCRRLGAGEYLLLNPGPHSFDGRYFGPTDSSRLVGKATLIWRW